MKKTKTGFPTDDLEEIADNGSLLPLRVFDVDNHLTEVLICNTLGGCEKETGLPSFLSLMSIKDGGENFSGYYRKLHPNEMVKPSGNALSVEIGGENFVLPQPVFDLLLKTSKERDYYKQMANITQQ